jgi:hypothetical protein
MAPIPPFDQRFIRNGDEGYVSVSSNVPICSVCGLNGECDTLAGLTYTKHARGIIARVITCQQYVPVISFKELIGTEGHFNTFRRGMGWARRIASDKRVRLFDLSESAPSREAVVTQVVSGPLGSLLPLHAKYNHLMLGSDPYTATERLSRVLVRLYGKTYAALDQIFTVIYMEPPSSG